MTCSSRNEGPRHCSTKITSVLYVHTKTGREEKVVFRHFSRILLPSFNRNPALTGFLLIFQPSLALFCSSRSSSTMNSETRWVEKFSQQSILPLEKRSAMCKKVTRFVEKHIFNRINSDSKVRLRQEEALSFASLVNDSATPFSSVWVTRLYQHSKWHCWGLAVCQHWVYDMSRGVAKICLTVR